MRIYMLHASGQALPVRSGDNFRSIPLNVTRMVGFIPFHSYEKQRAAVDELNCHALFMFTHSIDRRGTQSVKDLP